MAWMSGEALVSKLAMLAKYAVLPGVMAAAVIYSPPDFLIPKPKPKPSSSGRDSTFKVAVSQQEIMGKK